MANFEDRLIALVRQNPFLFDITNDEYRKYPKRRETWKMIARQLNSNATKCKSRWRSLRDCYRRRCKGGDTFQRRWKYYEQLGFLKNCMYDGNDKLLADVDEEEDLEVSGFLANHIPSYMYNCDGESSIVTQQLPQQQPPNLPAIQQPSKDNFVTYEIVELPDSPAAAPGTPTTTEAPPVNAESDNKTKEPKTTSKRPRNRRRKTDPVEREFVRRLNQTIGQLQATKSEKTSGIRKFLDSLATKIEDAQLPMRVLNTLEMDVVKLVHTTLEDNA